MARVVIDANVIVSAAFGGNPLKAVVLAMKDDEVYLSPPIQKELKNLIPRLSHKLTEEQIRFLEERVDELTRMAKAAKVTTTLSLSRDPKDDHYLALCKEVAADYLITGDKDLLEIAPGKLREHGVDCRIVTPQDFIVGR
jgi:uncharacterized protein